MASALLDPRCSVSLLTKAVVGNFTVRRENDLQLETMNMQHLSTQGQLQLASLRYGDIELGPLTAYVVPTLPFKVDVVLGLPLVLRHGCWIGKVANHVTVKWGAAVVGMAPIIHRDFVASFHERHWTVRWKWKDGVRSQPAPHRLNYKIAEADQPEFDAEVSKWIDQGILVRHDRHKHGEVQRFLPDGGSSGKGKWQQVYPVLVDPELWLHLATIYWHGEVYLLTRLGLSLTSAPAIMTAIVEWVMAADPTIHKAASNYNDDIFVREDLASVVHVRSHLRTWSLVTKEPEYLGNAAVRVLGLSVDSQFRWSRDKQLPDISGEPLTRRQMHQVLGEWVGHFPVVNWLRVASGFLQRCTASDGVDWVLQ